MRNIVVAPYDTSWPRAFGNECARLMRVFGHSVEIHHIGSTSVPGLAAKPVIDMLLAANRLADIDAQNDAMVTLGYRVRGELGIGGRRYFSKGGDEARSHHVHAYERHHPEVLRHLAFRNHLRSHPEAAQRYGKLKQELAETRRLDIEAYMAGKATMIRAILTDALA